MGTCGSYFPHDEFYDSSVREAAAEVAVRARPGPRCMRNTRAVRLLCAACRSWRMKTISLSDSDGMRQLEAGDFVLIARGRRYFSNDSVVTNLQILPNQTSI